MPCPFDAIQSYRLGHRWGLAVGERLGMLSRERRRGMAEAMFKGGSSEGTCRYPDPPFDLLDGRLGLRYP